MGDVHSDEGPDRMNLQELEEKVGGFQEFKDMVANIKGKSKEDRLK
jgi:hypothetical protein